MASEGPSDRFVKIVSDGLNELYDAGENAQVDLVFVHGLRGHHEKTWQAIDPTDGERIFWPKVLLPTTIERSRILSFGYPTDFTTFYPANTPDLIAHTTIDDHSSSLMFKLVNHRRETGTTGRPIIFIAHSLGGLVCANGLSSRCASDDQRQEVVNHTCGTVFLGTPFKGSDKAVWPHLAVKFLKLFGDTNDKTLKDLDKKSEKLQDISRQFHLLLQERHDSKPLKPIQVACFFETKSTIKKKWGINGNLEQIVTADSASIAGFKAMPIHADHSTMCKFADVQDTGYIDVTGALKLMIANLERNTPVYEINGKPVISLGDVKQGDNVLNYGIITGHIVGYVKDANKLSVSHTFNSYSGTLSEGEAAVKAWREKNAGFER